MKETPVVGVNRSRKLTKMERIKNKFIGLENKLRRGWRLSKKHPHYKFDEDGTITKVFPVIRAYELEKVVMKWADYPRAFRRRACKELYGTISPRIWQEYQDTEYKFIESQSR